MIGPFHSAARGFESTHWSLVVQAGHRGEGDARGALEALCERYWYPLYAYVRRTVADAHQAQDITQGFFAQLLEKNSLASASPARGRFRSFLLSAIKNFMANERDREQAAKRGGGARILSLDFATSESRISFEPADDQTPDRLFERQWVLTLLDLVMNRLREEYEAQDKAAVFDRLKGVLAGDREKLPYAEAADQLGISADAARQAASRLRKRYRELLRSEVAETLADRADIDDEIRSLFAALDR